VRGRVEERKEDTKQKKEGGALRAEEWLDEDRPVRSCGRRRIRVDRAIKVGLEETPYIEQRN
jgi:hypothetical protein